MATGDHERQRGEQEAAHGASLAHLLACALVAACACDAGTPDPIVDPDDVDGDGIANVTDVCPAAADPAQRDEDGDRVGDACDVCPTVPDPDQRDVGELDSLAFEDGVGDACDPRPSRGGDRLAALHAFAAADEATAWRGDGWAIAGGRARAAGDAHWEHRRAVTGDALAARLAIEELAWLAADASAAVSLDGSGAESGRLCALFADRDADGRPELEARELGGAVSVRALPASILEALEAPDPGDPSAPGTAPDPLTLVALRGVARDGGGTLVCTARRGAATFTASVPLVDNTTTGQYAIAARAAALTAGSLAVYGSPTACPAVAGPLPAAGAPPAALACDVP